MSNAPAKQGGAAFLKEPCLMDLAHPLLAPWTGPQGGAPPFDRAAPADFEPAFETAIAAAKAEIEAIAADPSPATFADTIEALERAGAMLTRVSTVFGVFDSAMSLRDMPDIAARAYPMLAAYGDWVAQHEALFARVAAVHDGAEMARLTEAQRRLVEDSYKGFVRNGVNLPAAEKARLSDINQRLAVLYNEFSRKILADEQQATFIEDRAGLRGLPPSLVDGLAAAAAERGREGAWAVQNTRSAVDPFLAYAEDRGLREQVWRAFVSRGEAGETATAPLIREILKLRSERARLLGYKTHAHWTIEREMAKTPEAALALLRSVWPKAVARAREEIADMQRAADKAGARVVIEPWDYRFYAEKVRKARYDLDMTAVEPYLQLEKLREGMMWAAGRLYGLSFRPLEGVPVYHPDVRVWEVLNRAGEPAGLWYFDPYAREGKQSGAWMNEYRAQQKLDKAVTPIVSNNANFLKPSGGKPVLISWDDAVTLFHEFGHALHGLLSDVDYPSQAGTHVARDFVEFPSQFNEHFLETPELLTRFAVHFETGQPLPEAMLARILKARKFNQGFATVEYLASALIDMELHLAGDADIDPVAFEAQTLARLGMPREIVMRHRTTHFSHVFSGDGYSAGYYSYLWADALTADAAEAFAESGWYDETIAGRLRDAVLAIGDTLDHAESFRRFRGRDVDPGALMRKRGFA